MNNMMVRPRLAKAVICWFHGLVFTFALPTHLAFGEPDQAFRLGIYANAPGCWTPATEAKIRNAFSASGCSVACCSSGPRPIADTTTLDLHGSWTSLKQWADRTIPCPDTACFRLVYLRRVVDYPDSFGHSITGVSFRVEKDLVGARTYSFVFVNVIDSLLAAKRLLHYKYIVYDYVALHELGHSYAGLAHCRNDCIMAKGSKFRKNFHRQWRLQDGSWMAGFCDDCIKKIAARP